MNINFFRQKILKMREQIEVPDKWANDVWNRFKDVPESRFSSLVDELLFDRNLGLDWFEGKLSILVENDDPRSEIGFKVLPPIEKQKKEIEVQTECCINGLVIKKTSDGSTMAFRCACALGDRLSSKIPVYNEKNET